MKTIEFNNYLVTGYIMYKESHGNIVVVEYSLETEDETFNPESFIYGVFSEPHHLNVSINADANIWA